jgi:gas vesicle protein
MKRRIVLATCLAGVIAGSAGAALAAPTSPLQARKHDVCIAIAQNENYHSADYYCVDTP